MVAEVRGLVPVGITSYGSIFYEFVFYFEFLSGSLQVLPNHDESCEFLYVMFSISFLFSGFSDEQLRQQHGNVLQVHRMGILSCSLQVLPSNGFFYEFVFSFEFLSGSLQVLPNYDESCEFLYVMLSTSRSILRHRPHQVPYFTPKWVLAWSATHAQAYLQTLHGIADDMAHGSRR